MLVQHLGRSRPPLGFGHELLIALVVGEHGRTDLRAEAPAVELVVSVAQRVGREVPDRMGIHPGAAARESVLARNGLVPAVAAVEGLDILAQPLVERRQGHALVVAAPDGDRRMVAQPLDFLHGVAVEGEHVVRQVGMRIEPEIVEDHDAVAIARLVELVVGRRTDPVADHVVVHLAVQADFKVILGAPAAEHILAHAPVTALAVDALAVDRELEHALHEIVGVLPDAECHRPAVGNLAVDLARQLARIEVLVAIPVGPPQGRVVDGQLRELAGVDAHGALLARPYFKSLLEGNVARADDAPHDPGFLLLRVVLQFGGQRNDALLARRHPGTHPRVDERHVARRGEIHVVGDAAQQPGDVGHPVPARTGNIGRAGMVGDRVRRHAHQYGQRVGRSILPQQVRDLEHAAIHKPVERPQPRAVEIDFGPAVHALEADPAARTGGQVFGRELGPVPEIAVVLAPVHLVGIVAEVGIGFDPRLDERREGRPRDDRGDPAGRIVTGSEHGLRIGHLVLCPKLPRGNPAVAVERHFLHSGCQGKAQQQRRCDQ